MQDVAFSVIVPTFRRPAALFDCLACLAPERQGVAAEQFEIIVGDDGADSALREELAARFPRVRYAAGPGRGPAANRNAAASLASTSYLVFTDDDCLPGTNWLLAYCTAVSQRNGARVFEGKTSAARPRRTRAEHAPVNEHGGYLWSCNFCIEASLFRSLGGFCEDFSGAAMEDVEFKRRIEIAGERIEFVEGAEVVHPWRTISQWSWFRMHGEATRTYLKLHPDERERLNTKYHIRLFLRRLVLETVPALLRRDWAGVRFMILDHAHSLSMAYRLRRPYTGARKV